MFKTTFLVLALSSLAANAAQAAAPGFCKAYANQAAGQYQAMKSAPGCARPPSNFWHGDRERHFGWCLAAPPHAVTAERAKRASIIEDCAMGYGQ